MVFASPVDDAPGALVCHPLCLTFKSGDGTLRAGELGLVARAQPRRPDGALDEEANPNRTSSGT